MVIKDFEIEIEAPAEKVWFALWDPAYYPKWANTFHEGTYMIGDTKEGGKVHFLIPNGQGIYSTVTQNKPFESMWFTHIGSINNFEEQELDENTKLWTGAKENYTLSESNGKTRLHASMESIEEHLEFFSAIFPKALSIVKQSAENLQIIIETSIDASIEKVWDCWTNPKHIINWNSASEDWHTTKSENDLRIGGKFTSRMEAKDGSMGFDFEGTYTDIQVHQKIVSQLGDRKVCTEFIATDQQVRVVEAFDPESQNSLERQKMGWQAILDNFKKYVQTS